MNDFTWNWGMPPMITPRTEISLIKSSTYKAFINNMLHPHFLCFKHIIQRILILLKPKLISFLQTHIRKFNISQRIILSSMNDNILILLNWSCSFFEYPYEPIMPAIESIMRCRSIAYNLWVICFFQSLLR